MNGVELFTGSGRENPFDSFPPLADSPPDSSVRNSLRAPGSSSRRTGVCDRDICDNKLHDGHARHSHESDAAANGGVHSAMMHMTWSDDDSSNIIRPWAQRAQNLQQLPVSGGSAVAPHQLSDARRFHLLARIAPRRAPASTPTAPTPGSSTSTKAAASAGASAYVLPSTSLTALQRATMPGIVPRWQQPTKVAPLRSFPSLKPVGIIKPKGELVFTSTPTRALGPFATVTFLSSADIDLEAGPTTPVDELPRSPSPSLNSSPASVGSHRTDEPAANDSVQPAAAAAAPPEVASPHRPKKQKQKKVKAAWKSAAFVLPEEGDTAPTDATGASEALVKSTKPKHAAKKDKIDITKTAGAAAASSFDGETVEKLATVPPPAPALTQTALPASLDESVSLIPTNSISKQESTPLSRAPPEKPPVVWPRRTSNPLSTIPPSSRYADVVTSKVAPARSSSPPPAATSQALSGTLSSSRTPSVTAVDREALRTPNRPASPGADTSFSSSYESDYDEEDSVEIITHSSTVPTLSGSASASARASRGVSPERHSAQPPLPPLPPGLGPPPGLPPSSLVPRQNLQPRMKTPIAIVAPPLPAPSAVSAYGSSSKPASAATETTTCMLPTSYVPRAFGSNPLVATAPSTASDSTTSSERPSTPSLSSTSSRDHGETESQSRRGSVSVSLASELLTPRDASPPRFGVDGAIIAKEEPALVQLTSATSHSHELPAPQQRWQTGLPHTATAVSTPPTATHETVPPTGPPVLPTSTTSVAATPGLLAPLVAAETLKADDTVPVPKISAPPFAPSSLQLAHQRSSQTPIHVHTSTLIPLLPPMQFASLADPTAIDYSVYTAIDGTQAWDLWPYGSIFVGDDTQQGLASHDGLAHMAEGMDETTAVDIKLVPGGQIIDETKESIAGPSTLSAYQPPAPLLTELPIEKQAVAQSVPPFLSTPTIMQDQQPSPLDQFPQRQLLPHMPTQPTGPLGEMQTQPAQMTSAQFQHGYVHLPSHLAHSNYSLPSPPIRYSSEIMVSDHILHNQPRQAFDGQGYHQPTMHHYASYFGISSHPQDGMTSSGHLTPAEGPNQYNYSVMMPSYPPGMQPWSLPPPAPMSAGSSNPPTTSNTPAPVLQFGETTPTLVGSTTFSASPTASILPGLQLPPTGTSPESPGLNKAVRFGQAAGEAMTRSGSGLRGRSRGGRGRGQGS